MTPIKALSTIIASVLLASCATKPTDSAISPSGRFRILYDAGTQETDAYYEVVDKLERVKGGHWNLDDRFVRGSYSICSGAEMPFDESRIIWSPSEMTFLVMFELDKSGRHERFLFVRQNDDSTDGPEGGYSKHWLVGMRALESKFFNGRTARIMSITDTEVSFITDNDQRAIEVELDALVLESQRQENQSDQQSTTENDHGRMAYD